MFSKYPKAIISFSDITARENIPGGQTFFFFFLRGGGEWGLYGSIIIRKQICLHRFSFFSSEKLQILPDIMHWPVT